MRPGILSLRALPALAGGLLALGSPGSAAAAPPTLDALMPSGGKVGTGSLPLTVTGKNDPWPSKVWCSNPGVSFKAGEKAGNFEVTLAADAPLGPCWVRTFNADGASEPRIFVVGGWREIVEEASVENGNAASAVDVGALPVVINGRLEKSDDIDAWKVSLKKGQTLHARVDGYSLRSGIDPFLHLYDPDGVRIALGSDHPRNLDPRLSAPIEKDGDYAVAVLAIATPPNANINLHGAAGAVWRLLLATEPITGKNAGVGDLDGIKDDTLPPKDEGLMTLPVAGFGTLETPGKSDRIRFTAAKGQKVLIGLEAVAHGFPTDPVLVLEKADGATIREVDDVKSVADAEYLYPIPADGEYVVRVSDRYGRGGADLRYHLSIGEVVPDFIARLDKSAYTAKGGDTATLKLTLTREHGHVGPLTVAVEGLPPGVTLEPLEIAEKATNGDLKLKIGAEAAAFSGPIRIRLTEKGGESPKSHLAAFTFQDSNARGAYLIDEIEDIWLTIPPKAEKAADSDKKS